jgi:hypothetical protein
VIGRAGRPSVAIELADEERETLVRWSRRHSSSQALALRSRIVLACEDGRPNTKIADELGCDRVTVGKWRHRFAAERLEGLADRTEAWRGAWSSLAVCAGDHLSRPGRPAQAGSRSRSGHRGRHPRCQLQARPSPARRSTTSPSTGPAPTASSSTTSPAAPPSPTQGLGHPVRPRRQTPEYPACPVLARHRGGGEAGRRSRRTGRGQAVTDQAAQQLGQPAGAAGRTRCLPGPRARTS